MPQVSLSGKDTIQIDGKVIKDLADGDCAVLEYSDELASVKASKNGNTIYALNESGRKVKLTLRLVRASADDKFLNSRLAEMKNDFSDFILLQGNFVKRVGDGKGKRASDVYMCDGGVFSRQPGGKTNAEGDTEQSVSIYEIMFGNGDRTIQ